MSEEVLISRRFIPLDDGRVVMEEVPSAGAMFMAGALGARSFSVVPGEACVYAK